LEVLAATYFVLAFAKNVRIKSQILQWPVSVLAPSCHQALSKNRDTKYFTTAVSKMEIFSLMLRGDLLEARAETSFCKIILCCIWQTVNKYTFVIWYTNRDVSYKDNKI
jgi:hypothetical protein